MSPHATAPTVRIRAARGSDGPALARLAALDSRPLPSGGPLLVAMLEGELVAALATDTGERIADPFRRTAGLLDLLAMHARRPVAPVRRRHRRLGLRPAAA